MANDRLQEAAKWWLQLREPNVPPETIANWMHWCDARLENLEAFESVQTLWQKAAAAPLRPVTPAELSHSLPRSTGEGRGGGVARWAIAAALLICALGALYFLRPPGVQEPLVLTEQGGHAVTPVGSIQHLALPDGSKVTLGASSGLSMVFTPQQRIVRLERGEAFFKVEKDARRPFVVMTSGAAVTAIGTAFNVRADAGTLKVTVAEGIVEVGVGSGTHPVLVRAGEELDLNGLRNEETPSTVRQVDPGVAASWTTGALKFMDEPLSVVVATVNRYTPTTIELEGQGLEGLRYTGTVVAGRIDEWLAALPNAFPVEIAPQRGGRVRIEPRDR